jgi:hypothetical protein
MVGHKNKYEHKRKKVSFLPAQFCLIPMTNCWLILKYFIHLTLVSQGIKISSGQSLNCERLLEFSWEMPKNYNHLIMGLDSVGSSRAEGLCILREENYSWEMGRFSGQVEDTWGINQQATWACDLTNILDQWESGKWWLT